MTQGASANLATLIARLKQAGVDWDGENIADLLWLVRFIDAPAGKSVAEQEAASTSVTVQTEIDDTAPNPLLDDGPEISLPQSLPTQKPHTHASLSGIDYQEQTATSLHATSRVLHPDRTRRGCHCRADR